MSKKRVNSGNPLFKETKIDRAKYGVSDFFKITFQAVSLFFVTIFIFIKKHTTTIIHYFTFKGMLERASHSVDETINNKKKRINFQTGIGVLAFGAIFATSSLVAVAAVAPEKKIELDFEKSATQTLTVTDQAILPDIIKEAVKTLYVEPKPQVDINTYGPESNDFVNNPNGIVQWPFWRGVPLSDGFGARDAVCSSGCSGTTNHGGQDFGVPQGAEIQAIADGIVVGAENFEANTLGSDTMEHSAGTYVMIQHNIDGKQVVSMYAHMIYKSSPLHVGDTVKRGQFVGKVGNTGMSTAPHLHLGIKINGTWSDPIPFLTQYNAINIPRQ